MSRCLVAFLVALCLRQGADAKLSGVTLTPRFNLFARVAHDLYNNRTHRFGPGESPCEQEPPAFEPSISFYVIRCPVSVRNVDVSFQGSDLTVSVMVGDAQALEQTGDNLKFTAELKEYEKPAMVTVTSGEQVFTYDIYRFGGDLATLASLSVESDIVMGLTPDFQRVVSTYESEVPVGVPFSIAAASKEKNTRVGIEFVDESGKLDTRPVSGLSSDENECTKGMRRHSMWSLPGLKTPGQYLYRICAIAPDGKHMTNYQIKVNAIPDYSVKLSKLDLVGLPYKLEPAFDPSVHSYTLEVLGSDMKLPFDIVSEDSEAKLSFAIGSIPVIAKENCTKDTGGSCLLMSCGESRGNTTCKASSCLCVGDDFCASAGRCVKPMFEENPRGKASITVPMHDNNHLKDDETPQWSNSLTVYVKSADDRQTNSYMVSIRQKVSRFAKLSNITSQMCELDPPFNESITEYKCTFWWESSRWAALTPSFHLPGCSACEIKLPDPEKMNDRHLSIFYQQVIPDFWMSPKDAPRMWNRTFLYGEYHTLPIEVISADKFTRTTYNIYMERECPWWMATRTTRLVSSIASKLATFLAFSSAGNFIALAKQLQFLDLTTDIDGIPKIFTDFADSVKGFNFDLTEYLPDFGLPTKKDFDKIKEAMVAKIQKDAGISKARLMIQYCYAFDQYGPVEANAILNIHEVDVKELRREVAQAEAEFAAQGEVGGEKAETSRRLSSGFSEANFSSRRLRGGSARALSAAAEVDLSDLGFTLDGDDRSLAEIASGETSMRGRRLDDEEDPHDRKYEDIWFWSNSDWKDFLKSLESEKITKDSYRPINCGVSPLIESSVHSVEILHKLAVLRHMLHSTSGSFLVSFLMIFCAGSAYSAYYLLFMLRTQKRLQVLEPMELWVFLLDYFLINFARHASKIIFQDTGAITLFFFHPTRIMVVSFCAVSLVVYPVIFTVGLFFVILWLRRRSHIVWDEDLGSWLDDKCREMRISIRPKVPPIPPIPQLVQQHLRAVIPVVDEEGEEILFGADKAVLLKDTIVRTKKPVELPAADDSTESVEMHTFGFVVSSGDGEAVVNFFGKEYNISSNEIKFLETRSFKKDEMTLVLTPNQTALPDLKAGARGKILEIIKSPEDGLSMKIAFGKPAHELLLKGHAIKHIAPERVKRSKKPNRSMLKKQIVADAVKLAKAEQKTARNEADELLGLTNRRDTRSKKEEEAARHLKEEENRSENHLRVLESLRYNCQSMAFVPNDKLRQGKVFFNIPLKLTTEKTHGLDYKEVDEIINAEGEQTKMLELKCEPKSGAAKEYNDNKETAIKFRTGDQIVAVNGVRGNIQLMEEQLSSKNSVRLDLRLRRDRQHKEKVCECPPWLYCDIEELRATAEEGSKASAYVAAEDKGWNKVIPLGDLMDMYKPVKGRDNTERLDPEEKFAILTYIEKAIYEEKRLHRYNIMSIHPRDGYLKPKEPITESFKDIQKGEDDWNEDPLYGDVPKERWWLTIKDYERKGDKFGGNPCLVQYGLGADFIENASGERLIFKGRTGRWYHGLLAPAGWDSGRCEWMVEPEIGWRAWEEKNGIVTEAADEGERDAAAANKEEWDSRTIRYADKWQWMLLERWERAWELDEDAEGYFQLFGGSIQIPKEAIPMYPYLKRVLIKLFRESIPCSVSREDKMEMRKWVWAELMKSMDMKLKFAWAALHHPKFYTGESLEQIAAKPFDKLLSEVEHSKPLNCLEHENGEEVHHELLDYALMKFEDMHEPEEEPWWAASDQPIEDEVRVMLDSQSFFATRGEEDFDERSASNDLIPPEGYFTSTAFTHFGEELVGKKRYMLLKPDKSETPFEVDVQMSHIHTLMRYTDRFKVNVPLNSLELPKRFQWSIVLGDKGEYEWYMYSIDRGTVLISIVVLGSDTTSFTICMTFLIMKLVTFVTQFDAQYRALGQEEEEEELAEDAYIKVDGTEDEEEGFEEMDENRFKKWLKKVGGKRAAATSGFLVNASMVLSDWHVMVPLLQTVTLGFLAAGLGDYLPGPIVAMLCILISCVNMLYMNLATMGSTLEKLRDKIIETSMGLVKTYNQTINGFMNFLAGDNIFGIAFIGDRADSGKGDVGLATAIYIMVPKLGLTFCGKPDIDDGLPYEEQARMTMSKKSACYIHRREGSEDMRPKSVKDNFRYERDVSNSLSIALDMDQLQHRKAIPQIVATIQCVNHCTSKLSRPAYDSYITLFKPENWEEEYDLDKEKVDGLVADWRKQVNSWMTETLGAVASDRTCTREIRLDILEMLRAECTQDVRRRVRKATIGSLKLPRRQIAKGSNELRDLNGLLASVMVLWDSEKASRDYPTSRCSGYGKFHEVQKTEVQFEMTVLKRTSGLGVEFVKDDEGLMVEDVSPNGLLGSWNETVQDPVQKMEPGDRIMAVKLDGKDQDPKSAEVFKKKGILVISVAKKVALEGDPWVIVSIDTKDEDWGFSKPATIKNENHPVVEEIMHRGAIDQSNQQQQKEDVHKPLISKGDIIVEMNGETNPVKINSMLEDETVQKATFKIKRVDAGYSLLPGFELVGSPDLTAELSIEEAKTVAILDPHCIGFTFDGDAKDSMMKRTIKFFNAWSTSVKVGSTCVRIERDSHIEYHCEIQTTFDVPLPMSVSKLVLSVWVQNRAPTMSKGLFGSMLGGYSKLGEEEAWEELIAYSNEIDIVSSCLETDPEDIMLHTKFVQGGKYKLEPWGGDENKDEEIEDGINPTDGLAVRGLKKLKKASLQVLSKLKPVHDIVEIKRSRGSCSFLLSDDQSLCHDAEEEDFRALLAVKDVLSGDSSMNIEKLKRHKDRWVDLAKTFGVWGYMRLGRAELKEMQVHLEKVAELKIKVDVEKSMKAKEDHCMKAGVRRQLAKSEIMGAILMTVNPDPEKFCEDPEVRDAIKDAIIGVVEDAQDVRRDSKDFKVNVFLAFQDKIEIHSENGGYEAPDMGVKITYTIDVGKYPHVLQNKMRSTNPQKPMEHNHLCKAVLKHSTDMMTQGGAGVHYECKIISHVLDTEMDRAVRNMTEDMEKIRRRHKEHDDKGFFPVPPHELKYRRIGYHIHALEPTGVTRPESDGATDEEMTQPFIKALLEELWREQRMQREGAKQILHYVCMSDHLKAGKSWKPDAIPPHVSSIVTTEFEDVPEVNIVGGASSLIKEALFVRDTRPGSSEPALSNGRLVYKALQDEEGHDKLDGYPRWSVHEQGISLERQHVLETKEMTIKEAKDYSAIHHGIAGWCYEGSIPDEDTKVKCTFVKEFILLPTKGKIVAHTSIRKNDLWLYWDGTCRWVISPKRGEPPPYGLKGQGAEQFMWVKDSRALTPDQISENWMYWQTSTKKKKGVPVTTGKWTQDNEIKAFNKSGGPGTKRIDVLKLAERQMADQAMFGGAAENGEEGVFAMAWNSFSESVGEMLSIFSFQKNASVDPSMKDALVSLSANRVSVTWKDDGIERLAPFRRLLLQDFGSYESAWAYMTSTIQMPRSLARRNLALMLYRTSLEIEEQEEQSRKQLQRAKEAKLLKDAAQELSVSLEAKTPGAWGKFSKQVADALHMQESEEILQNWGWNGRDFLGKSPLRQTDPDLQRQQFARFMREIKRYGDAQGAIIDAIGFKVSIQIEDTIQFEEVDLAPWLIETNKLLSGVDTTAGLPTYEVLFEFEVKHIDPKVKTGVKISETHILEAFSDTFSLDVRSMKIVELDQLSIKVRVKTADREVANHWRASTTTLIAIQTFLQKKETMDLKLDFDKDGKVVKTPTIFAIVFCHVLSLPTNDCKKKVYSLVDLQQSSNDLNIRAGGVFDIDFEQECKDLKALERQLEERRRNTPGHETSMRDMMVRRSTASNGSVRSNDSFMTDKASARQSIVFHRGAKQTMKDFLKQRVDNLGDPDQASKRRDDMDNEKRLQISKMGGVGDRTATLGRSGTTKLDADTTKIDRGATQAAALAVDTAKMTPAQKERFKLQQSQEEKEMKYEFLAAHLVDRLDQDRSGTIDVSELYELYKEDLHYSESYVQFSVTVEPYSLATYLNAELHHDLQELSEEVLKTSLGSGADDINCRLDDDSENSALYMHIRCVPTAGIKASKLKSDILEKMAKTMQDIGSKMSVLDGLKAAAEDAEKEAPVVKCSTTHAVTIKSPDQFLEDFAAFLRAHPHYRSIEMMWAHLSEDVEIGLEDFVAAMKPKMSKVIDPASAALDDQTKAENIFAQLDVQLSGGVTLKELIPSSGKNAADLDKHLLTFDVPLSQLKEIRLEGHNKSGPDGKQSVRFVLNPQFDSSKEWAALRLALNPDWEVKPGNETLQVCMLPQYFDLWRQVIRESNMMVPQEFIRHFDGGYEEHPLIAGTFMRHGVGVQRWIDGKVFHGTFRNHLYDGVGSLYESIADWQGGGAKGAIYSGEWFRGRRHGKGTLRWEQDLADRKGAGQRMRSQLVGIMKRYEGQFRDDLFHGYGVLEVEKAKAQTLNLRNVAGTHRPGYAPPQQVEPSQLLRFEGQFDSEWDDTDRLVRIMDPFYDKTYPEMRLKHLSADMEAEGGGSPTSKSKTRLERALSRITTRQTTTVSYKLLEDAVQKLGEDETIAMKDLDLEKITKKEWRIVDSIGHKKFHKYFPVDQRSTTQLSGCVLPDLALTAYTLNSFQPRTEDDLGAVGFDAMHLKNGKAVFADGTEYNGDFQDGRPHGKCELMIQYEHTTSGDKRVAATYAGEMQFGEKWGYGKYQVLSYDKDGNLVQAFRAVDVGSTFGKSKLMSNSVGLIMQTSKAIDKNNIDGVLQYSELKGQTVEQWCRDHKTHIIEWGSSINGVVEGDWLNVADGSFYVPFSVAGKGWMGVGSGRSKRVLERAEEEDGVIYEGQWMDNKKHGRGKQVIPFHLHEHFGYWSYEGLWFEDQRKGYGEMSYGERGEFLYAGPFQEDMRQGFAGEEIVTSGYQVEGQSMQLTKVGSQLSAASSQELMPIRHKNENTKNFGKVYLRDYPDGRDTILEAKRFEDGTLDPETMQSAFAKFKTFTGALKGKEMGPATRMTIQRAMLEVAAKPGCAGFVVETRDIWTAIPQPLSHSSTRSWEQEFQVTFIDTTIFEIDVEGNENKTTFWRVHDYVLLLNSRFISDVVMASKQVAGGKAGEFAWSHFLVPGVGAGRFYYGELTTDGKRHGVGTLYDDDAPEVCQGFWHAFESGKVFDTEATPRPNTWPIKPDSFKSFEFDEFIKEFIESCKATKLKGLSYHGQWKDNLPHGHGVQHFSMEGKGGGTYMGQFIHGRRHGAGLWVTNDGKWRYRPIKEKGLPNWDQDKMHGVAIVEDPKTVHENVIYTHGRCHMPFTDIGPPATGFDTTAGFGTVMKMVKSTRGKAASAGAGAEPVASIAEASPAKSRVKKLEKGVDPQETNTLSGAGHARGFRRKALSTAGSAMTFGSMGSMGSALGSQEFIDDDDEPNEVAVVREPTDLNMPEEDIMLTGGTGENAVLNGLYFKMTDTFGVPIYRHVHTEGWLSTTYVERFLYKDPTVSCWIVSMRASGGIALLPGCAFTEDQEAERPGDVKTPWYIWHPPSKTMKTMEEERDKFRGDNEALKKLEMNPVDELEVHSIVGFDLSNAPANGALQNGLMLRHASEFYGRPVYELEASGQFLYWMQNHGSREDGEAGGFGPDEPEGARKLFRKYGYWAVAREVGLAKADSGFYAYVEDNVISPDQISTDKSWYVKEGEGKFEVSNMKLSIEEWDRNRDLMDTFDAQGTVLALAPRGSMKSAGPAASLISSAADAEASAKTPLLQ